jgi:hypothetical protein
VKHLIIVLLAVLLVGACAYKHQPIHDVDKPVPINVQSLPLDRIESLIVEGGTFYKWQFQRLGEGHLVATQKAPKFSATVDIYFSQQRYRIVKNATTGLRDTGSTIHSHYNVWIRNLEQAIDARLSQASLRN